MRAFEIYAADVLGAYRAIVNRVTKHKAYSVWFILLMLLVFGGLVWFVALVINSEEVAAFPFEVNDLLFLFFMVFLGKSLLDYYHILIERPASVFLFVQPMSEMITVTGKLITVTVFNLTLLALGLGMITVFTHAHDGLYFVIPPYIIADTILLMLLASSIALMYSVLSGLSSWSRKITGTMMYSPMMFLIWLSVLQLRLDGWDLTKVLAIVYILSLITIPLSAVFIRESWNTMTSSVSRAHQFKRSGKTQESRSKFRRWLSPMALSVYEKEIKTLLRRREGIGNAITLVGFIIFAFYFYDQLGDYLDIPSSVIGLLPVLVVGLSLYLAVVLLCLIPALGTISKEGKGFWIIKSAPISEKDVLQGKALAIIVMLPFIIAFVALPVPILAGLPPISYLFSALGAAAMFMMAIGIGIWLGARYPNFHEHTSYSPDVMSMYIVMILCLVLSATLLIPPLAVAYIDKVLGFLALIMSTDIALLIFVLGMRGAEKSLEKMEVTV